MPKNRLTKPFVGKRSILFDSYVIGGQSSFAMVKQGIKISPTCNRAFCEPRHSAVSVEQNRFFQTPELFQRPTKIVVIYHLLCHTAINADILSCYKTGFFRAEEQNSISYGMKKSDIDTLFCSMIKVDYPDISVSPAILYRKYKAYKNRDFSGLIDSRGGSSKGTQSVEKVQQKPGLFLHFVV